MSAINHLILGYTLKKDFISLCKNIKNNDELNGLMKKLYEYNNYEVNSEYIVFEINHKTMKCCYEDESENEIPDTISIYDEDYIQNPKKEELKIIIINMESIIRDIIKTPIESNMKWGLYSYVKTIKY